jgi:hypothetical protein
MSGSSTIGTLEQFSLLYILIAAVRPPSPNAMCNGSAFLGAKRAGREADHYTPTSAKVEKREATPPLPSSLQEWGLN